MFELEYFFSLYFLLAWTPTRLWKGKRKGIFGVDLFGRERGEGGRLTQMWLGRSDGMLGFRVCEQICVRWLEGGGFVY